MEFPEGQPIRRRTIRAVVILGAYEKIRAASGRRCLSVETTRQQTVADHVSRIWRSQERDDCRVRVSGQCLLAVECIGADTGEGAAGTADKFTRAEIVGIRPHSTFR